MQSPSRYDSPLFSFVNRIADLVWLNVLTVLGCLGVVTAPASLTACHYAARKLLRGESYVTANFRKAFRENLLQAGLLGLVLAAACLITGLVFLFSPSFFGGALLAMVRGFAAFIELGLLAVGVWLFPLQAGFHYRFSDSLFNAYVLAVRQLPRTAAMIALWVVPALMLCSARISWLLVFLLLGLSVPTYLCARLYRRVFDALEAEIAARQEKERET
ncbi:MAG: YesL family protein [Oscillospiraceae bacterium]|nr:YesL family protein [Oscillospiraceae bacterium]